jgi:hypothetical protein
MAPLPLLLLALACGGGPPPQAAPLRLLSDAESVALVRPALAPGEVLARTPAAGRMGSAAAATLVVTEQAGGRWSARLLRGDGGPTALPVDLAPPPWRAGPALSLDVDGDAIYELVLMFEDRGERRPASSLARPGGKSLPPLVGEPATGSFRTVVWREAAGAWARDPALEAKVAGLAGPLPVQQALLGR